MANWEEGNASNNNKNVKKRSSTWEYVDSNCG